MTGGIKGAIEVRTKDDACNAWNAGVEQRTPFDRNAQVENAERRRSHAHALNCQREVPRIIGGDVKQLGENGERDRSSAFAGPTSDQ